MSLAVEFQHVTKQYGSFEALKGISFEVEEGAFFGLLGPNGAGKSTLINAMSGLLVPSGGMIKVHGYDVIQDYRQTRRLLGLVPQELIADPFFTIRQLLELQSGYFGIKGKEQKQWIDELLERLALADKANAITNQLSGGMKRRVLIAMALVHKPRVLVLDEPTAGVDVDLRHTLWEFTKELHQKGHTIILTTHYLEEAEALCEKVAIMQRGEVKALDTTSQLLATHPFRYVRVAVENRNTPLSMELKKRLVEDDNAGYLFRLEKEQSMSDMLGMLHHSGIAVKDVRTRDATLEEVFMALTGAAQA
ncbi:ABC transporter ATP-binding protein [Thiomicrorhabdus cannonii]|uniref:ABC transporter ATP-binding protein n=1 Tax=Thiomicrorhabdus cannonii TaxID=2748011 RepID=UPI0015BA355B|nr:ABC transporter ATP-binding protein [Thiomicrorhabdus cannonii]